MKGLRELIERSTALRYGAAAGSSGLALLVRMGLTPLLGDQLPFAYFFAGIAVAAWFGGVGPAILSAALGFALADLFFVPHVHAWWLLTTPDLAIASSYVLVALTIVILTQAMHSARECAVARRIELEREIGRRILAEEALSGANDELESRVRQRTAELNHAMEALERERGRFRDVLELLPVSIALLTPDRRISFANRIFRERFGEAHGQRRLESAGGGNAPCESIENFRLLETMTGPNAGTYQVFEYPYRDSDGQTLMLEVRIDITEVKRAYSAVSEQAALLQLAHDAIIVTDLNGRISFWNRGAEVLYGWRPEEAVGKNMQQLLQTTVLQHRQTTPVPSMDHLKALVRDEGQWTGELAQVTRSGQTMVVASRWSLRRNDQGDPDAVLEINTDISDRKRMEEALVEQTTELARSNKELQEFAYVASHDLQEPLRMVTNFTQLLAERYAPQLGGDAREFIAFAVDGTVRMQALIQDLLAYSRVGTQGRAFAPVACNEALSRAVSNLRISIAENAALVSHEELPVVQADATQLVQLFQNLIGNGIKFKGVNTPRVHVSAVRQADAWIFATQDNGIGIEAPYAERIFEIFQRLHRREEYPGTGIGLAICKKIVERHKGKIWMESEPGHGSTFFFSIPAAGIDAGVAAGEVEVKQHG